MSTVRPPLPSAAEIAALPADGGERYNRLIHTQSPYLLQHAANPVDWWPWGDEAFAAAREQDKPIFLSVGYSTCHWCHVMEHESFEDEAVAALMNEVFICIKVDREERPDVDSVYMTVTQALTGSGGWPMTVLMTAERKPFYAGTYYPKHGRQDRPGMMELIPAIANAWNTDRDKVLSSAESIMTALQDYNVEKPTDALDAATLTLGYEQLASRYDADHGGFGQRPKFPTPHNLTFLLRHWQRSGDDQALQMAAATAAAMRLGGVYDHVGYGIHRYSTDQHWLVPHFEKMLYDQALVSLANVELYQATGEPMFADTAREIFTYVLRDMTAPEGGFYSAEDADSEGEEGVFYVWTPQELTAVLGDEEASLYAAVHHITDDGNFHDEATGRPTGKSIPHRTAHWADLAEALSIPEAELRARCEAARAKLFVHREARIHPYKDDKVLTDWNGLMIAALARGGAALAVSRFTEAATRAAEFAWTTLRDADGRLLKRWRQGQAGLAAHLEDYAYLSWGYLTLYETVGDTRWLQRCVELVDHMLQHFWDEAGGFYQTADYAETLITRNKDVYDGAQPSGNSVAAGVLMRLARITGNADYETRARAILHAFSGQIAQAPSAHTHMIQALDFATGPTQEIVIAGDPAAADTQAMIAALDARFLPNAVRILRRPDDPLLAELAPFAASQAPIDGHATAYVCSDFACQSPTTDIPTMLTHLGVE